ncbi:MAG: hypothetical protein KF808_04250 [Cryobacterium sp.]|nr:hypothetical protein [Cryobacterium sp.]
MKSGASSSTAKVAGTGHRRFRIAIAIIAAAATVTGLSACAGANEAEPTEHIVTSAQSELLAITRFKNFDLGSRSISTVSAQSGSELHIKGWVDFASGIGYVAVTGDFPPQALLWTASTVGIIEQAPDADGNPSLPIPSLSSQDWQSRPLDASNSSLDALLSVIGNLGQDRPDNPLLLQQSGALWIRDTTISGVKVSVFAAPPSDNPISDGTTPSAEDAILRLWVDADGLMHRAELKLGDSWTTVDFLEGAAPGLELPQDGNG